MRFARSCDTWWKCFIGKYCNINNLPSILWYSYNGCITCTWTIAIHFFFWYHNFKTILVNFSEQDMIKYCFPTQIIFSMKLFIIKTHSNMSDLKNIWEKNLSWDTVSWQPWSFFAVWRGCKAEAAQTHRDLAACIHCCNPTDTRRQLKYCKDTETSAWLLSDLAYGQL